MLSLTQDRRGVAGPSLRGEDAGAKMGAGGIRQQNGRPPEIRFITLLEPDLEAAVKDVGIKLNVETVTKARQDEMVMHG